MKARKFYAKKKQSYQEGYVMCGRKTTFSHDRAKQASKYHDFRFYHCPYCEQYHLTKHK